MYEIRPETVKTFITDRNIKLPRFQRKQTWDEKKNFQLCISLFKEYPIGVSILSIEEKNNKPIIRWLLDGRQRKNALSSMYEDPGLIYDWAKKFIKFKNSDQPDQIEVKFNQKIQEYLESDPDDKDESVDSELDEEDSSESGTQVEIDSSSVTTGLELLLKIIKMFHNKKAKTTGFTRPFDITPYVKKVPYVDNLQGTPQLSSKKLKAFIDEFRAFCDREDLDYSKEDALYQFIDSRCTIEDETKLKIYLKKAREEICERIEIIEKIDSMLTNSKIGIIEVKNLSPSDSQKIFNIINTEGEKLTAVEISSAKPHWNMQINNPSANISHAVEMLYKRIGTTMTDVVKWDLPAILITRIGKNVVFKKFADNKTDFGKELTIGFKILSGLEIGGVRKEDIESLGKADNDLGARYEEMILNFRSMLKLIEETNYFQFLNTWGKSIMELTSDAIALNFFILLYKDWERKGQPIGSGSPAKKFQKNAFILYDKLLYEYLTKQWRGSSDSKIANNIASIDANPDVIIPIPKIKWKELLSEIFEKSTIDGDDIKLNSMTSLLYHFYCIKSIQGPGSMYTIEVDHIIPQTLFSQSTIDRKEIVMDNLLNLGLLPKKDNISKSNKRLTHVEDTWLKSQIQKYEFIEEVDYPKVSDINNYKIIFEERCKLFYEAFSELRDKILN
jgi:hypothetical protein